MEKEIISSSKAPKAVGPYSQAVKSGRLVFLSGQIPLDPQTGEIVGKDITEQTKRVMDNIEAILSEVSLDFSNLIQTTVYLKDMSFFHDFNSVYEKYFLSEPPARACVEVARLPRDVLVEVVATATVK